MQFRDLLHETYAALTANKTRTTLTVLGIVIGIASVIIMLSIGQGAQNSIQSSINSLGSNVLTVTPGGGGNQPGGVSSGSGSGKSLTLDDAEAIEQKVPLIDKVAPESSGRFQVVAGSKNTNTTVTGTVPAYKDIKALEMEIGVFITDAQARNFGKVAVLGPTVRDDLFGNNSNPVGKKVKINSNTYTVTGVTKSKGGSGFSNPDDMVIVPLSTAMQYLSGGDSVSGITVTTLRTEDLEAVEEGISDLLLDRHNIKDLDPDLADFNILNLADISSAASSITSIFTLLLGSVAGISLLVGGIGIMNMMLTTVRERTREIGLRKAIGAERSDISNQFLLESVIITSIGGIIGIVLGIGVSLLVTLSGVLTTSVSFFSVALAFGVSALIGVGFGYYPAKKASKLNPIEALRYE
ncbi:ABC transporter permease [Acetobacteraceae bacterium]|nr:ABC transporter permease [Candidatus Parcubacteria bacterium]